MNEILSNTNTKDGKFTLPVRIIPNYLKTAIFAYWAVEHAPLDPLVRVAARAAV